MTNKVCVIGLGYIGLPTALMFAKSGFQVIGVDNNEAIIRSLNSGELHIEENGLNDVFSDVRRDYNFTAQTSPDYADVFIIAVPTPITSEHTADLRYVISATKAIIPYLKQGNTVIIESTIPPRTTTDVVAPLLKDTGLTIGRDLFLAHCPERVLPGRIFIELVENNRIIGGYDEISAMKAAEPYRSFVKGEIILTSSTTAEMAKLMENTFRDVNIALVNELAKLSAMIGVNTLEVIQLANKHPRVNLHAPGPGVGGHCIAVDPYFIIEKEPQLTPLITLSRQINNSMPNFVVEQVKKIVPPHSKIAILGITYKGNIDDIRESPALEVMDLLIQSGYQLGIHDPYVRQNNCNYPLKTFDEAIENAECLIILADHKDFKSLSEKTILAKMKRPVIFDTKNFLERPQSTDIVFFNFNNLYQLPKTEHLVAFSKNF